MSMDIISISTVGFVVSLLITCIIMPFYIKILKKHNINQSVSEYALDSYKNKSKTPIMGGLIFVVVPICVYFCILPDTLTNRSMLFVILSFFLYCLVGFADDLLIILKNNNEGLSPSTKIALEFVISLALYFAFADIVLTTIDIPFINGGLNFSPALFLPLLILIYLSEANAVNFTDGMDGLCAGVSFIGLLAFAVIANTLKYYELFAFILCVLGGLIGYLIFNYHPAKIFMGDSGSLALGALFSSTAIMMKKEIALFVIGGVFVIEMFCVCLQLTSVKLFHKKIFSYTPIHYAFHLKGLNETTIVMIFYILAIVFALAGLYIGLK